jgi:hypothetical protein
VVSRILDPSTAELKENVPKALPDQEFYAGMAKNLFETHRKWLGGYKVSFRAMKAQPPDFWHSCAENGYYYYFSRLLSGDLLASIAFAFWLNICMPASTSVAV